MEHESIDTLATVISSDGISSNGDTVAAAVTLVDDELLVEEISIDGMCGVY
jgi:mycofactocin precursor